MTNPGEEFVEALKKRLPTNWRHITLALTCRATSAFLMVLLFNALLESAFPALRAFFVPDVSAPIEATHAAGTTTAIAAGLLGLSALTGRFAARIQLALGIFAVTAVGAVFSRLRWWELFTLEESVRVQPSLAFILYAVLVIAAPLVLLVVENALALDRALVAKGLPDAVVSMGRRILFRAVGLHVAVAIGVAFVLGSVYLAFADVLRSAFSGLGLNLVVAGILLGFGIAILVHGFAKGRGAVVEADDASTGR